MAALVDQVLEARGSAPSKPPQASSPVPTCQPSAVEHPCHYSTRAARKLPTAAANGSGVSTALR